MRCLRCNGLPSGGIPPTAWLLVSGLLVLAPVLAPAADEKEPSKEGASAKCVSAKASILRREARGKPWQVVDENEAVPAGQLLVGLPGAEIDSANGAVRLLFLADFDRNSPYPIREAAVVLQDEPKVDLALNLDRGRVNLINRHDKKGSARVRVTVREAVFYLTLEEPGTSVALELYGRWPAGVPFTREPGPKDVPTANLVFLVLKGHALLEHKGFAHFLKAPPGPAMMQWDSVTGLDDSPSKLEKLPEWADPKASTTEVARRKKEIIDQFRQQIADRPIGEVLNETLESDDPQRRRLAVMAMGALDDLQGLGKALREAKHPDVWDDGVAALRHWIGRGPGQDQILYQGLINTGKFSPVHAETVLQLLHSFGPEDLAMPETYQMLIDYLDHDKLAIRGLAHWHVYRLVPAGQKIGYSPMDPKEKREEAVRQWKKLVPPGKVPPRTAARANK